MTVDVAAWNGGHEALAEFTRETPDPLPVILERSLRELERLRQSDDPRDVLRPGSTLSLLSSAVLLCEKWHSPSHVQDADTLRPTKLMRREAQKVDVHGETHRQRI